MPSPNVLLVVLDAVRKDHLSCYGYEFPTCPNLEDFCQKATRYESAFTAAPWTGPSHASMFTGRYPSSHGVVGNDPVLSPDIPVVAERLQDRGYTTIGFSNSYHTSGARGFARGFDYYHDLLDLPRILGRMYEPSVEYLDFFLRYFLRDDDASYFQAEKLKTLVGRAAEPFFAFINFNSAHSPYDPPRRYRRVFEERFERWDEVDEALARAVSRDGGFSHMIGDEKVGDAEWELMRCWYDAEIAYMDDILDDLFGFLHGIGAYEETLVVITSDHGEHFGEGGLANHQFSLSEVLINVPLIVKWPGCGDREVSDELVSLVDLVPTFYDLLGEQIPQDVQGRSLVSDSPPEAVFAEYGHPFPWLAEKVSKYDGEVDVLDRALKAARTHQHKLVRDSRGKETTYAIHEDGEIEIEDPETKTRLGELIDERLGVFPDETDVASHEVDDHVRAHLEELGYM